MTRPRRFRACEAFAVLGVLLRWPWLAEDLEHRGLLGAFPAGTPRQCAALLAHNAGDAAECGWGVVFDTLRTLRTLSARARGFQAPSAIRQAMHTADGRVDHAALMSLAAQLSVISPALLADGEALLDELTTAHAARTTDAQATAVAFDAFLASDRVA